MDKTHGLCGMGKVSYPSVHQSWVNNTKSPAFWWGYSLCALFNLQKETGSLMVVKMNYLPLFLFLSHECPFLWLDWFPRVDSHLDYFLTHVGTFHGRIHAPIELMSICTSAVVAGGCSPLPQKDLELQQFLFWKSLYCWRSLKTWMESSTTPCAQSETRCPNSFIDPLKISLPVGKVSLEGLVRKESWSVLSLQIPNTGVQKGCGPESSGANNRFTKMGQATINVLIIDLVSFSCLWIT